MKKKLTAIFVSFMVFCSCLASWIPQTANAVFLQDYIEAYEQEAADPSATYAVIITFDDKGLSEYEAARRLGTGTFVQTAEGQNLYRNVIGNDHGLEIRQHAAQEVERHRGKALDLQAAPLIT